MKIIDRLSEYIEYKNISLNAFDKSIGASNGYIGRQIKNKASVGGDVIEKIYRIYTDINLEWLITGQGSMLKGQPDALSLASEPGVQYGRQNEEIRCLQEQVKEYKKELDNKQKIIENLMKTIDEQSEQIRAYRTGRIVNTDSTERVPKRGAG